MQFSLLARCCCCCGVVIRHLLLLLLLVCASATVDGYSTGPPSGACLSQQPSHTLAPKSFVMYPPASDAGFVISVNSTTWISGGVLTVTLSNSRPAAVFAGFILTARRASAGYSNPNLGPLLGNFDCTTSAGSSVLCKYHSIYAPSGEKNCVSHLQTDSYRKVTCQWTAPATNEGPIVFSATAVIAFENYQSHILSAILANTAGSPNLTLPDDALTERPSMNGCGSTKTCAVYPSACEIRGACRSGVMMTVRPSGDLLFEVFGTTFDWLAVGFGDRPQMSAGLEIVRCGYDQRQGKVVVSYGFSPAYTLIPVHRPDITMVKTMHDAGNSDRTSLPVQPNTIYCQFVRPIDAAFTVYSYNQSAKASVPITVNSRLSGDGKFVVLAQGQNIPNSPSLSMHTHIPLRSPSKFSASAAPTKMYFSGLSSMVQTHATLMTIFWLFLCGFGIIVARHTRPVLTQKFVKKQLWFLLHVGFMCVGYIVAVAGVIYILVKQGGWDNSTQIHGILGLIGMGLGLLNVLAGIFRPHPGAKFRPIFNRLHRWNGLLAYACSGVAIWLGATFNDHRPEFRFWAVVVLGIITGLQLVFMVGFEIARQRVMFNKRTELAIDRRFEMADRSDSAQSLPSADGASSKPLDSAQPKVQGKQLLHITHPWIVIYAGVFLALAAAFWAGLWIY